MVSILVHYKINRINKSNKKYQGDQRWSGSAVVEVENPEDDVAVKGAVGDTFDRNISVAEVFILGKEKLRAGSTEG